jgi:hypothetical protein
VNEKERGRVRWNQRKLLSAAANISTPNTAPNAKCRADGVSLTRAKKSHRNRRLKKSGNQVKQGRSRSRPAKTLTGPHDNRIDR